MADAPTTTASEPAASTLSEPAACPAHTSAWLALRAAHNALVDRAEAELAAAGLPSMSWCDVLTALQVAEDRALRPRELVPQVAMTKSGLTRLLDRIEQAGYIERRACPTDRRGHHVVLTETGAELVERMRPVRDAVFAEHFGAVIDQREASVIERSMRRVHESAAGGACAAAYE